MPISLKCSRGQTIWLAWLILVGAVVGCTQGPDRGPVELAGVFQVGPQALSFDLSTCHGDPEVSLLDETDTQIRIEVVSTVYPDGNSCADIIEVTLEQPLGDRELIDLTSGRSLQVQDP